MDSLRDRLRKLQERMASGDTWLVEETNRLLPEIIAALEPGNKAVCNDILRIMRVYHEQEESGRGTGTPGGLEHMGHCGCRSIEFTDADGGKFYASPQAADRSACRYPAVKAENEQLKQQIREDNTAIRGRSRK